MTADLEGFIDFFKNIPDHRINRHKLYPVEEILLVSFCAIISGCDGWADIELYGKKKIDFLRRYLPFTEGAPSDDTLRRFFRTLNPGVFKSCFEKWVRSFQLDLNGKTIAVDGKTSRRTFDVDAAPIHVVSAFASEHGIVLGQLKTEDKSNEITAIPELLDLLDIAQATVTIDAMGCQAKIAQKIIDKEAHYVLGLKGNQKNLSEDIRTFFKNAPQATQILTYEEANKGHGRVENRCYRVCADIQWLIDRHEQWPGLKSIIEVESTRLIRGEISQEKRYYISSLPADPQQIAQAIRQHWGIENQLHWVLDMSFGDDQSRIRKGNAPMNMAIIKKTALNLLNLVKKDHPRTSLKRMRKLAGWDDEFLTTVLNAKF